MTRTTGFVALLGEALGRPLGWDDLVLLRNFGSLRLDAPMADGAETRGFHARVLARDGRCTHYIKCRSASSAYAAREASVLTALRTDPSLADVVPPASGLVLPGLRALILGVVEGQGFARRVARKRLPTAVADVRVCLAVRGRLMARASKVGAVPETPGSFSPLQAIEPSLRILEESGVAPTVLAVIRDRVHTDLPSEPQHGDFTPANIIWGPRGPVILDFEFFGVVASPLYDVWHFIRNVRVQRAESSWLGVLAPRNETDAAWHALLSEEIGRAGLSERQVAASLLWYLSHITALIIARKNSEEYYRPYLNDLVLATQLAAGDP